MKLLSINIINIIAKYTNLKYFHFHIPLYEKHFTSKDGTRFSGLDKVDWISLSCNTNIPYTFF